MGSKEAELGGGAMPANDVAGAESHDDIVERRVVSESVEIDELSANGERQLVLRYFIRVIVLLFFL